MTILSRSQRSQIHEQTRCRLDGQPLYKYSMERCLKIKRAKDGKAISLTLLAKVGPTTITFVQPVDQTEVEKIGILKAEADVYRQVVEARNALDKERGQAGWPLVRQWYNHWYRQRHVLGRWGKVSKHGQEFIVAKWWRVIEPFIANESMDRIATPTMTRMFSEVSRTRGPSSMRQIYGVLDSMFNDAIRFGFDDGDGAPIWRGRWNPMGAIRRPVDRPADPVILSDAMVVQLLDASVAAHNSEPEMPEETCVIGLQVLLGIRVSEAAGLRWEQITLDERVIEGAAGAITWKKGERKSGRALIQPLPKEALRFLPLHRRKPTGRLWDRRCVASARHRVNKEIHQRVAEAGLPAELTSHDLRHSFAFSLMKDGASLDLIKGALGHGSVRTTEMYLRTQEVIVAAAHRTATVSLSRATRLVGSMVSPLRGA